MNTKWVTLGKKWIQVGGKNAQIKEKMEWDEQNGYEWIRVDWQKINLEMG